MVDKYSEEWMAERQQNKRLQRRPRGSTVYWIFTVHDGKITCLGYQPTEDEAWTYIHDNNVEPSEIFQSKSVDKDRVIQEAKGKIFSETHDLDLATQKFSRKME